jgi:hypothetical protein
MKMDQGWERADRILSCEYNTTGVKDGSEAGDVDGVDEGYRKGSNCKNRTKVCKTVLVPVEKVRHPRRSAVGGETVGRQAHKRQRAPEVAVVVSSDRVVESAVTRQLERTTWWEEDAKPLVLSTWVAS